MTLFGSTATTQPDLTLRTASGRCFPPEGAARHRGAALLVRTRPPSVTVIHELRQWVGLSSYPARVVWELVRYLVKVVVHEFVPGGVLHLTGVLDFG